MHRGRGATLALALAAIGVVVAAPFATGATTITPSSGPTVGGTTVALCVDGFTSIASYNFMGYAILADGRLASWGSNGNGQLGVGSTTGSVVPQLVSAGEIPAGVRIDQVDAGGATAYALGSDGLIYAWGGNLYGQVGIGTSGAGTDALNPVAVSGGDIPVGADIIQVDASEHSAHALTSTGDVYSWGRNHVGQLGDGVTLDASGNAAVGTDRTTPTLMQRGAIPVGVQITQLAGGEFMSYALADNGRVYSWGRNNLGQLGNGTGPSGASGSSVPTEVALPVGVTVVQLVASRNSGHALTSTGAVYSWGTNSYGQLGNGLTGGGTSSQDSAVPVLTDTSALPVGVSIVSMAAGDNAVYVLGSDGLVYGWGRNSDGQMANGTVGSGGSASIPQLTALLVGAIPSGVTVTMLAAGDSSAYALGSDGRVYGWGNNSSGQLGDGTGTRRLEPVLAAHRQTSAVEIRGAPVTGLTSIPCGVSATVPAGVPGVADVTLIGNLRGGAVAGSSVTETLASAYTYVIAGVAPPIVRGDVTSAAPNTPVVTITPLVNDSPNGTTAAALDLPTLRLLSGGTPVTSVTVSGGSFDVDPATGIVRFTPVAGFAGTATVDYRLADVLGESSSATIAVTVAPAVQVSALPATGVSTTILALLGSGLLALGAALTVAALEGRRSRLKPTN